MKKVHLFFILLYLILMLIGAFTRMKAQPVDNLDLHTANHHYIPERT